MMDMYQIHRGMLVTNREGDVMRVENPKIKKVTVMKEDGARWDYYPASLSPAPEGSTFNLRVEEAKVGLGSVVRFPNGRNPGMYAVIGLGQGNTLKLAKLFNEDGNRYLNNVAKTMVEDVSRADLSAYLSYHRV